MAERGYGRIPDRNKLAHFFVDKLVVGFVEPSISGRENIELIHERYVNQKPSVLAAVHFSNSDWPVIDNSFRRLGLDDVANDISVVQGSNLEKHAVARFLMSGFKRISIPSSRDSKLRENREEYTKRLSEGKRLATIELRRGNPVGVFMGRGRNYDGTLEKVPPDLAEWLQLVPDTAVFPIVVIGTDKVLKAHDPIPKFGYVQIKYGDPVYVREIEETFPKICGREKNELLVNLVMRDISRMLPEHMRGSYADFSRLGVNSSNSS